MPGAVLCASGWVGRVPQGVAVRGNSRPMFPWEANITAPRYTGARQPAKDLREKWLWGIPPLWELGGGVSLPLGEGAHSKCSHLAVSPCQSPLPHCPQQEGCVPGVLGRGECTWIWGLPIPPWHPNSLWGQQGMIRATAAAPPPLPTSLNSECLAKALVCSRQIPNLHFSHPLIRPSWREAGREAHSGNRKGGSLQAREPIFTLLGGPGPLKSSEMK